MGIMCGKLRVNPVAIPEQFLRVRYIADIGRHLRRKHRKPWMPADLGPFYLGIPIGPLDQPHHELAVQLHSRFIKPIQDLSRALSIGLNNHAKPIPAIKRRIGQDRLDHMKGQRQPVLLFGIYIKPHVGRFGLLGQTQHHRNHLCQHPLFLCDLEPRMQSRQLDRNAGVPDDRVMATSLGNLANRI